MFRLGSVSQEHMHASPRWLAGVLGNVVCRECRSLNRKLFPYPVDAVLLHPPRTHPTHGGLFRAGVPVYRVDFVHELRDYLGDHVVGKCVDENGEDINEYVTMYTRTCVLMRGDSKTTYKVCNWCGSVWTDLVMVFPGRPAYLLRHQLTRMMVYQDHDGIIFAEDEIVNRIDWRRFPDIRPAQIEVRDTPLDGRCLPEDPGWRDIGVIS